MQAPSSYANGYWLMIFPCINTSKQYSFLSFIHIVLNQNVCFPYLKKQIKALMLVLDSPLA